MPVSAPSPPRLHSPFIHCPINFTPSSFSARNLRSPSTSYPRIKAELDPNTVVAISVGVASVALGIGIPVFYETQIDNAAKRENTQPCFPCNGTGAPEKCRLCVGSGNVTVELGGGEKEVSNCINCDGAGSLTCTTCQGSGVQPRYLDRSTLIQFVILNLSSCVMESAFLDLKAVTMSDKAPAIFPNAAGSNMARSQRGL
ncbi:F10A5.12 [Arabidopsis thaliana]|nr:F10A5.12 [Arabidopsis thaliana]